jgi:hypothetical protein
VTVPGRNASAKRDTFCAFLRIFGCSSIVLQLAVTPPTRCVQDCSGAQTFIFKHEAHVS